MCRNYKIFCRKTVRINEEIKQGCWIKNASIQESVACKRNKKQNAQRKH